MPDEAPARSISADDRLHAPAAERNGQTILEHIEAFLRPGLSVLEIASGPGQHAALFAEANPKVVWQPSDPDPRMRISEAAWSSGLANVPEPLDLDVTADGWWSKAGGPYGLTVAINMLHCSEPETIGGLMAGAAELLETGGHLLLYGPFTFNGLHSAPSNQNFDRMLRRQNALWGVRDLNDIASTGHDHGLAFERAIEMPANNHILVLRRHLIM
ncbi:MAG: DUF938 domain-containing protein [Rhodospirillales bacterium]|nr:DUF938 domain-containing protein [Rhodospirillales bacterium]